MTDTRHRPRDRAGKFTAYTAYKQRAQPAVITRPDQVVLHPADTRAAQQGPDPNLADPTLSAGPFLAIAAKAVLEAEAELERLEVLELEALMEAEASLDELEARHYAILADNLAKQQADIIAELNAHKPNPTGW